MIKYSLRCERDHAFESWFQSSSAYDSQLRRKLITCPACGSTKIDKALMAPQVASKKGREHVVEQPMPRPEISAPAAEAAPAPLLMAQEHELRTKLRELRDHIIKNADNVGEDFAKEARAMHYGDVEHRPIYGEASPDEARELIDEGIEVAPLPMLPEDRN